MELNYQRAESTSTAAEVRRFRNGDPDAVDALARRATSSRVSNRRVLPLQQKTPLRGGGALLGLLQGGEIYVSLYMWIRGR